MECIYVPELNENSTIIPVPASEVQHLKALRLKPNEKIFVTNGTGITATANVTRINNTSYIDNFEDITHNFGELGFRFGLAIGLLDNRERLEFALEKAVELGVTDFHLLQTKFSANKKYSHDRLIAKSIAAMKQCRRSILPNIYNLIDIREDISKVTEVVSAYKRVILADGTGINVKSFNRDGDKNKNKDKDRNKDTLIFIGPEGGFSKEEIFYLVTNCGAVKLSLAGRRLRAETAAVLAAGIISVL